MLWKSHIVSGGSLAGIAAGGWMTICNTSDRVYERMMPVAYGAYRFLFPTMNPVLKTMMILTCLGGYVVGTLAPDADNPNSMVGRRFYIPVGHRVSLHSIWPVLIFACLGRLHVFLRPLIFFALGWLAHLICDSFSMRGVRFFWPISGASHRFRVYTTGEATEYIFVGFLFLIAVLFLVTGFFPGFIPERI